MSTTVNNYVDYVDEIVYCDSGSACFFTVKCDEYWISFRIHYDDPACFKFFAAVDSPILYPDIKSSIAFNYGSSIRKPSPGTIWNTKKLMDSVPSAIINFDEFLKTKIPSWKGLKYYGGYEVYCD